MNCSKFITFDYNVPCAQPPKKEFSQENQIRHAYRIISLLLPWLRKLRHEQMVEKELEANVRGI
jgi:[histone H3]-dimethyl-L-lysine9 demethylase